MDFAQASQSLSAYEPFLRHFRAPSWLRARLAIDTDDVRSECRWRALQAIDRVRTRTPHLSGTADEVRIVRRAIARAFVDLLRRAHRRRRSMDHVDYATIQAGVVSWASAGMAASPEEEYLAEERERAIQRACDEIRRSLGDDALFDDALRVADGCAPETKLDRKQIERTSGRRRRALASATRSLPATTIDQVVDVYGGCCMEERRVDSLNDDDLARVGIVYRRLYKAKIDKPDRAHLLEKVQAVNTTPDGQPYGFPPCFGDPKQYDPKDSSCSEECDFRIECRAIVPAYYDRDVEAQLAQLKGLPEPAPAKESKAQLEAAQVSAQSDSTASEPTKEDPKEKPRSARAKSRAEKPQARKKMSGEKREPKPQRAERAKRLAIRISNRRGISKGKNARPRMPQGSAAELAAAPVGTTREREYRGVVYYVKKIADGKMSVTAGGFVRKRDGTWALVATAKVGANGKVGPRKAHEPQIVGSLGIITRYITGTNAWSAARFWSFIPPLLDPKSDSYAPEKYEPTPVYAYEEAQSSASTTNPTTKSVKPKARSSGAKKANAS